MRVTSSATLRSSSRSGTTTETSDRLAAHEAMLRAADAQHAARAVLALAEQQVDRRQVRDEVAVQLRVARVLVVLEVHAQAVALEERDVEIVAAARALDQLRRAERLEVRDDAQRRPATLRKARADSALRGPARRRPGSASRCRSVSARKRIVGIEASRDARRRLGQHRLEPVEDRGRGRCLRVEMAQRCRCLRCHGTAASSGTSQIALAAARARRKREPTRGHWGP